MDGWADSHYGSIDLLTEVFDKFSFLAKKLSPVSDDVLEAVVALVCCSVR